MNNDPISVPVLSVTQPIGQFFIGVMKAQDLVSISSADMRRIEKDLDRFVGIQRKLDLSRVKEISAFVGSVDGTFPTSVVLSVRGVCATYDESRSTLILHVGEDPETGDSISMEGVANILDGQHRVEGLKLNGATDFDVPVSIFVDADLADQAYIFSTVNLAQTKVNRSLVFDLLDYAKARSPQKSAHDVVVVLDHFEESPLQGLIKRLGVATPGRTGETLAQATVVGTLIPLISIDPEGDRYALAKGKKVHADDSAYEKTPFRLLWTLDQDDQIALILMEYFDAVSRCWPDAWKSRDKGNILPRTNGFRAFMRLFKNIYLREKPRADADSPVVKRDTYMKYLAKIKADVPDSQFSTSVFNPGTSGETALYKLLREKAEV